MTFEELRSELDDLAGLELTTSERDRLLNEGARELACRAEWTRKTDDIGPTVANQAAYTIPSDMYRALRLTVNGYPYMPSDEEDAEELTLSRREIGTGQGIYYVQFDSSGTESYALYPVPSSAGLAVNLTYVYRPEDMDADEDEPAVPKEFRRGIVDYAAAIAYGADEDNVDLRTYHMAEFDRRVAELAALRISRLGRAPAQMRVKGIHW